MVFLRSRLIKLALCLFYFVAFPSSLWAQAALENPQPGSFHSGVGVISGWKCTANQIDFLIDGRVIIQAAYGTGRADTQAACGDTNNGFGLLVNWNDLGNGQHTLVARADGIEFARSTFTVTTLGTAFLRGTSGQYRLADFPFPGTDVTVTWQESTQSFVLAGVTNSGTPTQNTYQVHGIEEHLACSDRRQNERVTFSGTLTGTPANGAFHLFYDTGVEVRATVVGIQNVAGVVVGNFSAQSFVNGRIASESQGSFHGIAVERNISLTYLGIFSTVGCSVFGTLAGTR
jgi:hypothetical protein